MNPYELSILDAMLQQEDWENVGGFIKYKLFGLNYKKKFENMVRSADEEILKKTLINIFSNLNDQLDYINARNAVKSKFSTNNFKKIRIPQFSETGFGSFVGLLSCFSVYKQ